MSLQLVCNHGNTSVVKTTNLFCSVHALPEGNTLYDFSIVFSYTAYRTHNAYGQYLLNLYYSKISAKFSLVYGSWQHGARHPPRNEDMHV